MPGKFFLPLLNYNWEMSGYCVSENVEQLTKRVSFYKGWLKLLHIIINKISPSKTNRATAIDIIHKLSRYETLMANLLLYNDSIKTVFFIGNYFFGFFS